MPRYVFRRLPEEYQFTIMETIDMLVNEFPLVEIRRVSEADLTDRGIVACARYSSKAIYFDSEKIAKLQFDHTAFIAMHEFGHHFANMAINGGYRLGNVLSDLPVLRQNSMRKLRVAWSYPYGTFEFCHEWFAEAMAQTFHENDTKFRAYMQDLYDTHIAGKEVV